jgi:hypothetical protein
MVGATELSEGRIEVPQTVRRVETWVREQRLPSDERRAARTARKVEELMRRERDHHDERARQLAAVEAERRRWGRFG